MGTTHGRDHDAAEESRNVRRRVNDFYTGGYSPDQIQAFLRELLTPGMINDLTLLLVAGYYLQKTVDLRKQNDAEERVRVEREGGQFRPWPEPYNVNYAAGGVDTEFSKVQAHWQKAHRDTQLWSALQKPAQGSRGVETIRIMAACLCAADVNQFLRLTHGEMLRQLFKYASWLRGIEDRLGTESPAHKAVAHILVEVKSVTGVQGGRDEPDESMRGIVTTAGIAGYTLANRREVALIEARAGITRAMQFLEDVEISPLVRYLRPQDLRLPLQQVPVADDADEAMS
jgi:hypothetical protein